MQRGSLQRLLSAALFKGTFRTITQRESLETLHKQIPKIARCDAERSSLGMAAKQPLKNYFSVFPFTAMWPMQFLYNCCLLWSVIFHRAYGQFWFSTIKTQRGVSGIHSVTRISIQKQGAKINNWIRSVLADLSRPHLSAVFGQNPVSLIIYFSWYVILGKSSKQHAVLRSGSKQTNQHSCSPAWPCSNPKESSLNPNAWPSICTGPIHGLLEMLMTSEGNQLLHITNSEPHILSHIADSSILFFDKQLIKM